MSNYFVPEIALCTRDSRIIIVIIIIIINTNLLARKSGSPLGKQSEPYTNNDSDSQILMC